MPDRINRILRPLPPLQGTVRREEAKLQKKDFAAHLAEEMSRQGAVPEFSGHALSRLTKRGIQVTGSQLARLGRGVEIARSKGCRDSLVLVDDLAFVVSVKNNRVVTAIDGGSLKERVFTNIDSAVLM